MSVTNTPRKAGPYTGNNTDVQFTFGFKVFADSDLVVTRAVIATGAESTLVLTTDYTVTRNADQDTAPGGYVTLTAALADTYTLTLTSAVPDTQPAVFTNLGGFFPAVLNNALDRLTILVQQLKETVGRSLKLAVSTPTGFDATLPAPVPYAGIAFNAGGTGFTTFGADAGTASALAADLAGNGGGAMVGVGDAGAYFEGEDVEAVLQELGAAGVGATRTGRTSPHANFDWFTADFTVTSCAGAARAMLAQDIADVFQTKFGASIGGTTTYVHPLGSDTNGGTSWRDAFLTLGKALRNTTGGVTYVWPGTYDLSDFRYTDSYGDHPKKVIAPFGNVTLRIAGDDISAATWGLNGDYGGVYQMHVAATSKPLRILRTDLLDKYGEPTPMPQYADLTALGAVNFGWAYDGAYSQGLTVNTTNASTALVCINTKSAAVGMAISGAGIPGGATITAVVPGTSITISAAATATATGITATVSGHALWVRAEASANVNTVTKTSLRAIYGDATGDTRTLLYSTTSYWEGVTFRGYISLLKAAGQAVPQFWAKRCKFEYANNHALLNEGGYSYMQDCIGSRTSADGANYNTTNGTTARGVEINYTSRFAGDVGTFGQAQTLNPQGTGPHKNGSSNHDSYVVRINGTYVDCFGPNTADTAGSYTWMMGSQVGYNALPVNSIPSTPRYGILNQGNHAWLDGCAATGVDAGFNADSSADVRTFNCAGTLAATAGGVFTAYVPT